MKRLFLVNAVILIYTGIVLGLLLAASIARAQTVVAVDITKGKIQWSWADCPVNSCLPTKFNVKVGTTSGNYTSTVVQNFVASPTNTYSMPVSQAVANKPGTYFVVITAQNAVGESPPTNEVSFFAGTVPGAATSLVVLAQ